MVTNFYAMSNYDQLHINKALDIFENRYNNNSNKNNLRIDYKGPFRVQKLKEIVVVINKWYVDGRDDVGGSGSMV